MTNFHGYDEQIVDVGEYLRDKWVDDALDRRWQHEIDAISYYLHGYGYDLEDKEIVRLVDYLADRHGSKALPQDKDDLACWIIEVIHDTE